MKCAEYCSNEAVQDGLCRYHHDRLMGLLRQDFGEEEREPLKHDLTIEDFEIKES